MSWAISPTTTATRISSSRSSPDDTATSPLLTTNKPFAEWAEVFPNASCVVTLVDRLTHHAEIVKIEANSYRRKEAKEAAEKRAKARAKRRSAARRRS